MITKGKASGNMCSVHSKKWKETNNLENLKKAFGKNGEWVVINQMRIPLINWEIISLKNSNKRGRKRKWKEWRDRKWEGGSKGKGSGGKN